MKSRGAEFPLPCFCGRKQKKCIPAICFFYRYAYDGITIKGILPERKDRVDWSFIGAHVPDYIGGAWVTLRFGLYGVACSMALASSSALIAEGR